MGCFSILTSKLNSNKDENENKTQSSKSSIEKEPILSSIYQSQAASSNQNQNQSSIPVHPSHLPCCSFEPLPAYQSNLTHTHTHSHGRFDEKKQKDPLSPIMTEVSVTIEETMKSLDEELRDLSLKMWNNPEIMWEEKETHDLFTSYFDGKPGWKVTRHAYTLETAYSVEFTHKPSTFIEGKDEIRTIGFNSEMDALKGLGHACGHNLIAIAGVAASLSVANALVKHDIPGRVKLLGTPAEEGGGGKIVMLKEGAYSSMSAALMIHPSPSNMIGPWLAVQPVNVFFTGRAAHAGASPYEGLNSLDAAVISHTNIACLRQQIRDGERIHGIIMGNNDWSANVIPDKSQLLYNIRSPTKKGLKALTERVKHCFEAAALATGCQVKIEWGPPYADVQNSQSLASSYQNLMSEKFNIDVPWTPFFASSDFGDVTYALPSAQPAYKIHLDDPSTQGNHTIGFAEAAKTKEAHERTIEAALGIAITGARIVVEKEFYQKVRKEWEDWKKSLNEDE